MRSKLSAICTTLGTDSSKRAELWLLAYSLIAALVSVLMLSLIVSGVLV